MIRFRTSSPSIRSAWPWSRGPQSWFQRGSNALEHIATHADGRSGMLFGFVRGCVGLRPGASARGRITNQLSNPGLTYHSRVFVTCRATGSNVWFHAFGRCCQESYATQPTPSAKSRTPTGLWVEPFRITATLLRNRIFSAQLRVDTKLSRFVYTPAYRSLARFLLSSNLPTALTTRCSPVAWSI
jgi:hypothetical protein